jgi:hypothetical protein
MGDAAAGESIVFDEEDNSLSAHLWVVGRRNFYA